MPVKCSRCIHSKGGRKCRYKAEHCSHYQKEKSPYSSNSTPSSSMVDLKFGWVKENGRMASRDKKKYKE